MPTPLHFKGDKKPPHSTSKKRKRPHPPSTTDTTTNPNPPIDAAAADEDAEDETWLNPDTPTDLTGPSILVLPTHPPTTLATSPNGTVHPSLLHNLIDDNPASAEPHAIPQVWVANQIAGTHSLSFKASSGTYLSCDAHGTLSATKEAVGPEEQWDVEPVAGQPAGVFGLKNTRGLYLAVEMPEDGDNDSNNKRTQSVEKLKVRGDGEAAHAGTKLRIRMQARFKPRVKVQREERAREKISRKQLEEAAGRKLENDQVKMLKRARRQGTYHEALLDVKVKGKSDKFA